MFPDCPHPNNHTETRLITTLFGQYLRCIPTYLLYLKLTHFCYFIFYLTASGLLPLASEAATWHLSSLAATWCLSESDYSLSISLPVWLYSSLS